MINKVKPYEELVNHHSYINLDSIYSNKAHHNYINRYNNQTMYVIIIMYLSYWISNIYLNECRNVFCKYPLNRETKIMNKERKQEKFNQNKWTDRRSKIISIETKESIIQLIKYCHSLLFYTTKIIIIIIFPNSDWDILTAIYIIN